MKISQVLEASRLSDDTAAVSLEVFVPDSPEGCLLLRQRIDRLATLLEPLFVDIVGAAVGEAGAPANSAAIALAAYAQKYSGVPAAVHLTVPPAAATRSALARLLDEARAAGVRNVVLERGIFNAAAGSAVTATPAAGVEATAASALESVAASCPDQAEQLPHVADAVRLARARHGDFFCIGVMTYPSGLGEYGAGRDEELARLLDKQAAGADFALAQHCLEAGHFLGFRKAAEAAGVAIPILPSVLPWHSRDNFVQVNAFCGVPLPPPLRAEIERLAPPGAAAGAADPPDLAALGLRHSVSLCRDLLAAAGGGARVLHLASMNSEGAVLALLRELGLTGPEAASRRKLPWRPSADVARLHEEMRPIFWANRPAAYVERTAHWTEFPSGRWKTARGGGDSSAAASAAFAAPGAGGALSSVDAADAAAPSASSSSLSSASAGAAFSSSQPTSAAAGDQGGPAGFDAGVVAATAGDPFSPLSDSQLLTAEAGTPEQRRAIWGANPVDEKNVWQVFAGYMRGSVPRLPWCDKALLPETSTISGQLERLNSLGFLTINSQPRVNAARSDDPTFGWGGPSGLVFQKAYVECFCPRGHLAALMEAVERSLAASTASHGGHVSYTAINAAGVTFSSRRLDCAMALTWGVFQDREIQQPTIVDYSAFRAWKAEAFALWLQQWASIYEEGSEAAELIRSIHDDYFLVNVVDNDFVAGNIFRVFEAALVLRKEKGDRSPDNVARGLGLFVVGA